MLRYGLTRRRVRTSGRRLLDLWKASAVESNVLAIAKGFGTITHYKYEYGMRCNIGIVRHEWFSLNKKMEKYGTLRKSWFERSISKPNYHYKKVALAMDKRDTCTDTDILQTVYWFLPSSSYNCCFTLPLAVWQGLIAVTKKERPKYIGQLRRLGTRPKQKQTPNILCSGLSVVYLQVLGILQFTFSGFFILHLQVCYHLLNLRNASFKTF